MTGGARALARRAVERAIVGTGLARAARGRRRGDAIVLAYHDIVPRGEAPVGDRSLHLGQAEFGRQLDLLCETHQVVPLDQLRVERGAAGRPRVAITFDDAYQGALTAGTEELAIRGLPATVFVTPAFVGGQAFWWDQLADDDGLPAALRNLALEECRGEQERIIAVTAAMGRRARALPDHATCADEATLRAATTHADISLGSHTWSHANLARLERDEVVDQLSRALAWLHDRFAVEHPWLTFPYGRFSPLVQEEAMRLGHRGALRIDGGWVGAAAFASGPLPRLNVPAGLSLDGFRLRLAGLLCT